MANIKETHEVGFDDDGFAVHKPCGNRLTEEWSITRTESYGVKRDGTTVLIGDDGDDKGYEGTWCGYCDAQIQTVAER